MMTHNNCLGESAVIKSGTSLHIPCTVDIMDESSFNNLSIFPLTWSQYKRCQTKPTKCKMRHNKINFLPSVHSLSWFYLQTNMYKYDRYTYPQIPRYLTISLVQTRHILTVVTINLLLCRVSSQSMHALSCISLQNLQIKPSKLQCISFSSRRERTTFINF